MCSLSSSVGSSAFVRCFSHKNHWTFKPSTFLIPLNALTQLFTNPTRVTTIIPIYERKNEAQRKYTANWRWAQAIHCCSKHSVSHTGARPQGTCPYMVWIPNPLEFSEAYPHSRILFRHKKDWSTITRHNLDELKNIMLSERSQTQWTCILDFRLYEVSSIGKSTETVSRSVVGLKEGQMRGDYWGVPGFFLRWWLPNYMNILETTELYILLIG